MDRPAYTFADVRRMRRLLLVDWDLPSEAALDALRIGDYVKIGAMFDPSRKVTDVIPIIRAQYAEKVGTDMADQTTSEYFWVVITDIRSEGDDREYVGRVSNFLAYTEHHGLARDDTVTFRGQHVQQIHEK
jgi:hypothetical protein